ncbi:hypothetical protein AAE478_003930 [Parahypoxylon ruwenzoriense]
MSGDIPTPVRSPESDVSPKSQPTPRKADYFALEKKGSSSSSLNTPQSSSQSITPRFELAQRAVFDLKGKGKEIVENTGDASATTPGETASSTGSSGPPSRKGSISSVTFAPPRNPSLPQGLKKPHAGSRIRAASPPHPTLRHFPQCWLRARMVSQPQSSVENLSSVTEELVLSVLLSRVPDTFNNNPRSRDFRISVPRGIFESLSTGSETGSACHELWRLTVGSEPCGRMSQVAYRIVVLDRIVELVLFLTRVAYSKPSAIRRLCPRATPLTTAYPPPDVPLGRLCTLSHVSLESEG